MKQTNQNFLESSSVQETQVTAAVFSCTEIPGRNPGILYHCFALRKQTLEEKRKIGSCLYYYMTAVYGDLSLEPHNPYKKPGVVARP